MSPKLFTSVMLLGLGIFSSTCVYSSDDEDDLKANAKGISNVLPSGTPHIVQNLTKDSSVIEAERLLPMNEKLFPYNNKAKLIFSDNSKVYLHDDLYEELWKVFKPKLHEAIKDDFKFFLKMMCNMLDVQKKDSKLCFGKPPHKPAAIITGFQCALGKVIEANLSSVKDVIVDGQRNAMLDLGSLHKPQIKQIEQSYIDLSASGDTLDANNPFTKLKNGIIEHAPCENCIASTKNVYGVGHSGQENE